MIRDLIVQLGGGASRAAIEADLRNGCVGGLVKMQQRPSPPAPEGRPSAPIIVIEKRVLVREALARRLSEELGCAVVSFSDIDSWRKASSSPGALFILVSAWENDQEAIQALRVSESRAAVILLSDATDLDEVVRTLKHAASASPID